MKAIISSTFDDKYFFFVPIAAWCWGKLGVGTILITPEMSTQTQVKNALMYTTTNGWDMQYHTFKAPSHKEATYAQCSRLYAASLGLPEKEILITSDVDMALFRLPVMKNAFTGTPGFPYTEIIGSDLVPDWQYPMCYISAPAREWKKFMQIGDKSLQECLDELLGHEEMENMKGNLWSRDQETAFNKIRTADTIVRKSERAKPGTQFATHRLDRDDSFILDRLSPDIIDFHMNRPGYENENFNTILTVLKYFYPNDNFDWLIDFRNEYIKLL